MAEKQPSDMTKDELLAEVKQLTPRERLSSPYFLEYEKRGHMVMGSQSQTVPTSTAEQPSLGGFEATLSAPSKAKAIEQMNTQHYISGKFQTRKQYVDAVVARGSVVGVKQGQPAIIHPNGDYMLQKDISKTAIDYARFLLHDKGAKVTPPVAPTSSFSTPSFKGSKTRKAKRTGLNTNRSPKSGVIQYPKSIWG